MKLKGFTLIELLVVIAIIGVLATVVTGAVNGARAKGRDAAVKSNLANAQLNAELFYDANSSSYTNVCTTGGANNIYDLTVSAIKAGSLGTTVTKGGATTATTGACNETASSWAVEVPYKAADGSTKYYCTDWSGTKSDTGSIKLGSNTDVTC